MHFAGVQAVAGSAVSQCPCCELLWFQDRQANEMSNGGDELVPKGQR
jgi:hypothetical protein